jgi:hypothetical protein
MTSSSPPAIDNDEKWYKLKMAWSNKVYDIEIGSNDLYVLVVL